MNNVAEENDTIEDILEGDFTAETAGDVSIPDDLFDVQDGSARYPLPSELVRYKYEPVVARVSNAALSISERVVVTAIPTMRPQDMAQYEVIAETLSTRFPVRIARLRDLYSRLHSAQMTLLALQTQREQERSNINWRNSVNNERIDEEIKALRKEWETHRERLRKEIVETETALKDYRAKRYAEVERVRSAFWEARLVASKTRDEMERTEQSERKTEERNRQEERLREVAATREHVSHIKQLQREEAQKIRDEAYKSAEDVENDAVAAETRALATEQEAIERIEAELSDARERYLQIVREVTNRLDVDEEMFYKEAAPLEEGLLKEKRTREEWLHECQRLSIEDRRAREQHIMDARARAAKAAAQAGLAPGEAAGDYRSAIKQQMTEDVVAAGNRSAYPVSSLSSHWITKFLKVLALVACGFIFGISLGILTGTLELSDRGLERTWLAGLIGVVLGIALFYLMGQLAHRVTAYASEEFHAVDAGISAKSRWRPAAAVVAALFVVFGMITIEAYVERYGIVQAVIERKINDLRRSGYVDTNNEDQKRREEDSNLAYWAVALIVAAPFVLYHAYEGAMDTRYAREARQRKEYLAKVQHEQSMRPELALVCETQEQIAAATQHFEAHPAGAELTENEAKRRIEEINKLLATHPVLVRWRTFIERKDDLLNEDPLVVDARQRLESVQDKLQSDAGVALARSEAKRLRTRATAAREFADKAHVAFIDLVKQEAEELLSSVNNGTGFRAEASFTVSGEMGVTYQRDLSASASGTAEALVPSEWTSQQRSAAQTWEEAALAAHLREIVAAIRQDPQTVFYRSRMESLRTEIRSRDTQFGKRLKQLTDQKRAIELYFAQRDESNRITENMQRLIAETSQEIEAAQILFDEEVVLLKRLVECPGYLRWLEHLRQTYFVRDSVQARIDASKTRNKLISAPVTIQG